MYFPLEINLLFKLCRLINSLHSKLESLKEDLKNLHLIDQKLDNYRDNLESILDQISCLYVYDSDQDTVEHNLEELKSKLDSEIDFLSQFLEKTKEKYQNSQQLVPIDLGQKLAALELRAEDTSQAMEEKKREQKRAKTARTDYLSDVDDLQTWFRETEINVQDRSCEPEKIMERIRQMQSELPGINDKIERMTKNGKMILTNIKDEAEKEIISATIANLTEQLVRVKTWLEEKKQLIGDTLDAWQRFLNLLESVKAWTAEKRVFLQEPLRLSSLNQARQKLHEYAVGICVIIILNGIIEYLLIMVIIAICFTN